MNSEATNNVRDAETASLPTSMPQLAAWCGRQQLFANWSPETLRDYLAFHGRQRTLFVVQTSGELEGVAIAWQCRREDIWRMFNAALEGGHMFDWQPDVPGGEMLFIAEVVAKDRATLMQLCEAMAQRFPGYATMPVWTFRRKTDMHRLMPKAMQVMRRGAIK